MGTKTEVKLPDSPPETGHGRGVGRDEPRSNTVCFTVTQSEQRVIDALSMCIHLRRSAILTEIVTRFMKAVAEPPRNKSQRNALIDFLEECRDEVSSKGDLFDELSGRNQK
jgi:hypothetical protein